MALKPDRPNGMRQSRPRIGWAIALPVVLVLAACNSGEPRSADPVVDGTVHVCSSCHGLDGRSINPTFPRLAGQQHDYIVAQLKAFRDHTRADPHAHTYMWGMAAELTDKTIDGLADYYSSQTPVAGTLSDPALMAAGKTIFTEGIADRQVPACAGCHGEKGAGVGSIPRLAGQHQSYIAEQLVNFASMARANEIMHDNSKNLTPEEIHQVAAYVGSL